MVFIPYIPSYIRNFTGQQTTYITVLTHSHRAIILVKFVCVLTLFLCASSLSMVCAIQTVLNIYVHEILINQIKQINKQTNNQLTNHQPTDQTNSKLNGMEKKEEYFLSNTSLNATWQWLKLCCVKLSLGPASHGYTHLLNVN